VPEFGMKALQTVSDRCKAIFILINTIKSLSGHDLTWHRIF